jgi:hypothetical protein
MREIKNAVFFGELLMRLGTKGFQRFVQARNSEVGYTGAKANAAVALANCDVESYVVSTVLNTEIVRAASTIFDSSA